MYALLAVSHSTPLRYCRISCNRLEAYRTTLLPPPADPVVLPGMLDAGVDTDPELDRVRPAEKSPVWSAGAELGAVADPTPGAAGVVVSGAFAGVRPAEKSPV